MTENKPKVRINFVNGLSFQDSAPEILGELLQEYNLIHDTDNPQVVVYGPYGNNVPEGDFIRVGYYCENFTPDLEVCDYAFGIPYESEMCHPRYRRIDFHGLDPRVLLKSDDFAANAISHHTHFCNFLYANPTPYREKFFDELSKYKKPDAPGRSRNNMQPLSTDANLNLFDSKRRFIKKYKFTIAFENYTYPGYHTEKIIDPMIAGSMPVYLGNPDIELFFNSDSFIDGRKFLRNGRDSLTLFLEKQSQPDYKDFRPSLFKSPTNHLKRKLKKIGRQFKLKYEFRFGFEPLIEEIIRLDRDEDAYYQKLCQPWFINNQLPDRSRFFGQWKQIFEAAQQQ
jgi:hypothetical protein